MSTFLEDYAGQYRRFDFKEALNILLMHIRIDFKFDLKSLDESLNIDLGIFISIMLHF